MKKGTSQGRVEKKSNPARGARALTPNRQSVSVSNNYADSSESTLNPGTAPQQQFTNLSGCSSTVVNNISHSSRLNRPNLSQDVAAHDQSYRVNNGSVVYGGDDEQRSGGYRQVTLRSEDAKTLAIR
jgi:hypothetical protein